MGRDGCQPPDREAARPRSRCAPRCTRWRRCPTCWTRWRASWTRARRSTGCVRWWRRTRLLDIAAAEARFAALRARFGEAVGLAHGRQDAAVRDAALADFAAGRMPAAGGHHGGGGRRRCAGGQRDGDRACRTFRPGAAAPVARPGRARCATPASACCCTTTGLNETARRRLTLLRDTEDGFVIADEDFRLRGGGDVLGTRQAGLPGFRLADPVEHEGLLHMAHRDAAAAAGEGSRAWPASAGGRCACCCGCSRRRPRCGRWQRDEDDRRLADSRACWQATSGIPGAFHFLTVSLWPGPTDKIDQL